MKSLADFRPDQHEVVDFICSGEDALVYADVGAGKTVMALTAALRFPQYRWLILAPKKVALNVWHQEVYEWAHLKGVAVGIAVGPVAHREKVIASSARIVVINYENLMWLCERYEILPFDAVICDEIDKLKDPTSKRFKMFRRRIQGLQKRVGMTGTPAGDHLLDLWAQAFIVDGGESLGKSYYMFRAEYFYQADFGGYDWRPFPGAEEKIYARLQGLVIRAKAPNVPIIWNTRKLDFPTPQLRKEYRRLERVQALKLESGEEFISPNAATTKGKLQQFTAGFLYAAGEDEDDPHGEPVWLHHAKFEDFDDFVSEVQGAQVMVVYQFTAQRDELMRRHRQHMDFLGRTDVWDAKTIEEWNNGSLQILGVHPGSAGHGLNLQHSKARYVYFMQRPWSAGMLEQVYKRLARPGGADTVYVHTPVIVDSVDEDVIVANDYKEGFNAGAKAAFAKASAKARGDKP